MENLQVHNDVFSFGDQLLASVREQIKTNTPKETSETYDRLRGSEFSDEESVRMIASVLASITTNMTNDETPFDWNTYRSRLKLLGSAS